MIEMKEIGITPTRDEMKTLCTVCVEADVWCLEEFINIYPDVAALNAFTLAVLPRRQRAWILKLGSLLKKVNERKEKIETAEINKEVKNKPKKEVDVEKSNKDLGFDALDELVRPTPETARVAQKSLEKDGGRAFPHENLLLPPWTEEDKDYSKFKKMNDEVLKMVAEGNEEDGEKLKSKIALAQSQRLEEETLPTCHHFHALDRLLFTCSTIGVFPKKQAWSIPINYRAMINEIGSKYTVGAMLDYEKLHRRKYAKKVKMTAEDLKEFCKFDKEMFDHKVEPLHRQAIQSRLSGSTNKKAKIKDTAAQSEQYAWISPCKGAKYTRKELEDLGHWKPDGAFWFRNPASRLKNKILAAQGRSPEAAKLAGNQPWAGGGQNRPSLKRPDPSGETEEELRAKLEKLSGKKVKIEA